MMHNRQLLSQPEASLVTKLNECLYYTSHETRHWKWIKRKSVTSRLWRVSRAINTDIYTDTYSAE